MVQAKEGDTVRIHYSGSLEDGTVFDSSQDREPLEFTLGEGKVIPGFEKAVIGLDEGGKTQVKIEPDEAYGQRRDDLIVSIDRQQIADQIEPELGMTLQASAPDGSVAPVTIVDMDESTVTLDGNHPLAGKTLNFEIELVSIG